MPVPARPASAAAPSATTILLRTALIGLAAWLLFRSFSDEILLTFFAILLACGLRGSATRVAVRLHVPLPIAFVAIALAASAAFLGIGWWLGPNLIRQGHEFAARLPQQWSILEAQLRQGEAGRAILSQLPRFDGMSARGLPDLHVAGTAAGSLGTVIVVVATAAYLAAAPDLYVAGLLRLAPPHARPHLHDLLTDVGTTLRAWLIGQVIDMTVAGTLAGIGLALVGVPLPIMLGLITGLCTFVPYAGAIAAAIPAILLGLSKGPMVAASAIVVYTLCHLIESYVVAPLVQQRMVRLPPALTILSILFGGAAFGVLGIMLATPIAAAAVVAVRRLYVEDRLEPVTILRP